jgi:hypothetical protein
MTIAVNLEKSYIVYLKPNGEICNRLKLGTKVHVIRKKGEWAYICWRSGKKKGWILLPEQIE